MHALLQFVLLVQTEQKIEKHGIKLQFKNAWG